MKKVIFIPNLLRFFLTAIIIILTIVANTQSVAINNSGASANNSSMLDVSSTTKGMLLPRMTSTQRTAINTPAEGLIVYDTDTKGFWYYTNSSWNEIPKAAGSSFTLPYAGTASDPIKVFSITNTSTLSGSSGVNGKGIIGVHGESTDNNYGIGVLGASMPNDINGVGVRGTSYGDNIWSGAVTGINYGKGIGVWGESLDSGIAVYGKTRRQNGPAVYGINESFKGRGIQGTATGTDGIGVYGEAGNSGSLSWAGYFRNSNVSNTRPVVQIDNLGTGYFISLTNGAADVKTSIAKDGDITTDGTMTVKSNKGIVRSSTSTQLRTEVVPAVFFTANPDEVLPTQNRLVSVTFSTPFSAAPAVFVGNLTDNGINSGRFTLSIINVTTTGCTLRITNPTSNSIFIYSTTWNLVAIGAE
jgi:hypothetical protein